MVEREKVVVVLLLITIILSVISAILSLVSVPAESASSDKVSVKAGQIENLEDAFASGNSQVSFGVEAPPA